MGEKAWGTIFAREIRPDALYKAKKGPQRGPSLYGDSRQQGGGGRENETPCPRRMGGPQDVMAGSGLRGSGEGRDGIQRPLEADSTNMGVLRTKIPPALQRGGAPSHNVRGVDMEYARRRDKGKENNT